MDNDTCLKCGGCCISVGIWYPLKDINNDLLTWHLYHGATIIYTSDEHVYGVEYPIKCKHLTKDNLCAIFDNRPSICRENKTLLSLRGCVMGNIQRFTDINSLKEVF